MYDMPSNRQSGLDRSRIANRELSSSRYRGTSDMGIREEALMLENIRDDEKQC